MSEVSIKYKLPKETQKYQQTLYAGSVTNVLQQTYAYINEQIDRSTDENIKHFYRKTKKFIKKKMKEEGINFKMPMFE